MAKPSKRKGPVVTAPKSTSVTKRQNGPPSPYSLPPALLIPFLETLDPKHVYITHIDRHPKGFKKKIFTVPILLNIGIIGLLAWRATYIFPFYSALVLSILGYSSPLTVDTANTSGAELFNIAISRTGVFVVDFTLIRFVASWPFDFFVGESSPTSWRLNVGFNDAEIAVRRSRTWDSLLPKNWLEEEADGPVYKERIMPAIDRKWIRDKTSYLMMDKSWDLDFAAMTEAHALVKSGKNHLRDFEKTVIVHSADHGWLVWQVYKLDEGAEDESRQKLVLFKDKLTAMGKENLFFRWIELIQFESSQAGGFTRERQVEAMKQAKSLFEDQGVDFDQFWEDVGGMEGLPGMATP